MDKIFIVVTTNKSGRGYHENTKMTTINNKENVLEMVKNCTSDSKTVDRIFSVDEFGQQITFYEVVFEGHLKLIEKIK